MMSDFKIKNYLQSNYNLDSFISNENQYSDPFESCLNGFCQQNNLAVNEEAVRADNSTQNLQQKISKRNLKRIKWNLEEIQKYEFFCITYLEILLGDPQARKQKKIFKKMSEFICSRNPIQCKTHHQKCFKNFQEKLVQTEYGQNVLKFFFAQSNIKNSSKVNESSQMVNNQQSIISMEPQITPTTEQQKMTNEFRDSQLSKVNNSFSENKQENQLKQQFCYQNFNNNYQSKEQFYSNQQSNDQLESYYDQFPIFDGKKSQLSYQQLPVFFSAPLFSVKNEKLRDNLKKQ